MLIILTICPIIQKTFKPSSICVQLWYFFNRDLFSLFSHEKTANSLFALWKHLISRKNIVWTCCKRQTQIFLWYIVECCAFIDTNLLKKYKVSYVKYLLLGSIISTIKHHCPVQFVKNNMTLDIKYSNICTQSIKGSVLYFEW